MNPTSDHTQHERRLAPRARLEARATVHLANEELLCQTRDLSTDGLSIFVDDTPAPSGTFMRVFLKLPTEQQTLDLDGILVRTDPQSTGIVWGLRFIAAAPDVQTKIEKYVSSCVPGATTQGRSSRPGEGFTSVGGDSQATRGRWPEPWITTRKQ